MDGWLEVRREERLIVDRCYDLSSRQQMADVEADPERRQ